jgi:hypothetical protein
VIDDRVLTTIIQTTDGEHKTILDLLSDLAKRCDPRPLGFRSQDPHRHVTPCACVSLPIHGR